MKHDLDCNVIDEVDEISGDEQLALVWCNTHGVFEWHWLPVTIKVKSAPKHRRTAK